MKRYYGPTLFLLGYGAKLTYFHRCMHFLSKSVPAEILSGIARKYIIFYTSMDEAQNSKPSRKRASASSSELNEKPEFVLKPKDGENTEKLDERRFYLWGR